MKHSVEVKHSTRLELSRRTDLADNVFSTFLGRASEAQVRTVFGAEAVSFISPLSDAELAARLEDLAKSPDEPVNWLVMDYVIGNGVMPLSLYQRFLEILRNVSFEGLARRNLRLLGPALTFACQQAKASGDESLVRRMEEVVMGFAPFAASQVNDKTAVSPLWLELANALLELAVLPNREDFGSLHPRP